MPNSPTLAQYRTEVRRLLHDSTGKFWSNTELNDYINDARARVAADTGCLRSLISGVLSPGLEAYAIGGVTGAVVVSGGSGYSSSTLAFSGGGGSGAAGTVTVVGGVVTAVAITNSGSGYTSAPTAVPSAAGQVASISVTDAGIYDDTTSIPTVTIGGGGSGAAAHCTMFPISVAAATGGSGYVVGDDVLFVGGTSITPTVLRVLAVSGGQASSWQIVQAGEWSGLPPVSLGATSVIGGSGTGATVYLRWAVKSVVVTAPGSGYASATAAPSGGTIILAATFSATVGGPGSGAVIQTYIIPLDTADILNVTVLRGNQRVPLGYMSFTEFNATMRCLTQNPQFPYRWSRYGTSGGEAYLQPVPDIAYPVEWDTCIIPDALVADGDIDVLQYPYTAPVAYYAAWKAKLKQQSYAEAEGFLGTYGKQIIQAQAAVQMRRIPNPYGGYSGA